MGSSGEIDLEEINRAPPELKAQLSQIVNFNDVAELFRILDYDQSGSIGIDEFLDGVVKAQGEKPIEFTCLMKQCADIRRDTRALLLAATGGTKALSNERASLTSVAEE